MDRKETLEKAYECVAGQREQDYGRPEDSLGRIADLWTAYYGSEFSPVDVAMMMALLKVARIKGRHATEDSFVDIAGYAAIGCEVMTGGRVPPIPEPEQEAPKVELEAPKAEQEPRETSAPKKEKRGGARNKKKFDEAVFYRMLDEGRPQEEIAKYFGASKAWASYTAQKLIQKREEARAREAERHEPDPEAVAESAKRIDIGRAAALHNAGWPVEKIADELGVEYDAAYGIIKALVEGKLTVPKRASGETEEAAG